MICEEDINFTIQKFNFLNNKYKNYNTDKYKNFEHNLIEKQPKQQIQKKKTENEKFLHIFNECKNILENMENIDTELDTHENILKSQFF